MFEPAARHIDRLHFDRPGIAETQAFARWGFDIRRKQVIRSLARNRHFASREGQHFPSPVLQTPRRIGVTRIGRRRNVPLRQFISPVGNNGIGRRGAVQIEQHGVSGLLGDGQTALNLGLAAAQSEIEIIPVLLGHARSMQRFELLRQVIRRIFERRQNERCDLTQPVVFTGGRRINIVIGRRRQLRNDYRLGPCRGREFDSGVRKNLPCREGVVPLGQHDISALGRIFDKSRETHRKRCGFTCCQRDFRSRSGFFPVVIVAAADA